MSDAKLIADALRALSGKGYGTSGEPVSTLFVWTEFRRLANIIERKLAEREADQPQAIRVTDVHTCEKSGVFNDAGDGCERCRVESEQKASFPEFVAVPGFGSHPEPSNLDELQKAYENARAEEATGTECNRAFQYIAALEAEVKRLQEEANSWQATCKSICDEWNEECEGECNSYYHDEKCAGTMIIQAMRQRRERAEQAERERDEARALIAEYEREPTSGELNRLYNTYHDCNAGTALSLCEVIAKWREIAKGRVKS